MRAPLERESWKAIGKAVAECGLYFSEQQIFVFFFFSCSGACNCYPMNFIFSLIWFGFINFVISILHRFFRFFKCSLWIVKFWSFILPFHYQICMVIWMRIAYNVSLSTCTHEGMAKIPMKIRLLEDFSHLRRALGVLLYLISYSVRERDNFVPNFFFKKKMDSLFFFIFICI